MAQVLIRNVSEDTVDCYRQRARNNGISLEQELRNLLEANRPFTPEERVLATRAVRAMTKGTAKPLTLDEIREGLE